MSVPLTLLTLLAVAALCGAVGWFAARDMLPTRRALAAALLAALGIWAAVLFAPEPADAELRSSLPMVGPADDFASSNSCGACHPGQYDSWHETFHRTMTQVAGPDTVQAPFDGRTLHERNGGARVLEEEGRYYVESIRSGRRWRVVLLTGSHHLQAFWIRLDDGRLAQFPFVYLIREQRWLANSDSFLQPEVKEDSPFEEYIWGEGCVSCHSTGGPWDPESIGASVTTSQAVTELGIACEACHGPAREHVELNRDPSRRYALHAERRDDQEHAGDPTIQNPRRLDAERSASICGRCHTVAEYRDNAPAFYPGSHLADSIDHPRLWRQLEQNAHEADPERMHEGERDLIEAFWNNGTVRVAGREYDGMVRSRCYLEAEMSCVSCHRVHGGSRERQLPEEVSGSQMCGSCHESIFADVTAHTHHDSEGAGSECVSCHMPYTSYGLLMATRSHRLDSPVASGFGARAAPNACNLCHQDQSLAWTEGYLQDWFQRSSPTIPEDVRDVPAGALWLLRGDAVQRALAAWHLRQEWVQASGENGDQAGLEPALTTLLGDPVSAVRQVGGRTLELAHPEWGLDLSDIASAPQPDLARQWRGTATGVVDQASFEALAGQRIDLPVSIPE